MLKKYSKGSSDYLDNLTDRQMAGWLSLIMAINEIDEYCLENKLDFTKYDGRTTPIKNYISEKLPFIENCIKQEKMYSTSDVDKSDFGTLFQCLPPTTVKCGASIQQMA